MRWLTLLLLLAACSQQPPEQEPERLLYAGDGRDRLCVAGDRVGVITYGENEANCSVRGRAIRDGEQLQAIRPDGDPDCRIPVREDGEMIRLGNGGAACAYYCGPGVTLDGRVFHKDGSASPAVDFAGDPLC